MPKISTIILSYNRKELLQKTVESYLSTVSIPFEMIIVDNASTDGAKEYIQSVCKENPNIQEVFLNENLGGEALNLGMRLAKSEFIHISENDLEYLPGWDVELLSKFEMFPELGQLSVYSPEPQSDKGEIWEKHPAKPITRNGKTIYLAEFNIATPSVFRREIYDKGGRWKTQPVSRDTYVRFPEDREFSEYVKSQGFWVAWNDKYVVFNLGHNVAEWIKNLDYYLENYRCKVHLGEEGMRKRLRENGYDLVKNNNKYKIIKL